MCIEGIRDATSYFHLGSSGHTCGLDTSPDCVVLDDIGHNPVGTSRPIMTECWERQAGNEKQPRAQLAIQPERILAPRRDVVSSSGAIGSYEIPTIIKPRIMDSSASRRRRRQYSRVIISLSDNQEFVNIRGRTRFVRRPFAAWGPNDQLDSSLLEETGRDRIESPWGWIGENAGVIIMRK